MFSRKLGSATVKGLERSSLRLFTLGMAAYFAGLGMTFTGLLFIGPAMLILSAILLLVGIGWVVKVAFEPSQDVHCPHCVSVNQVYVSRAEFRCDVCRRIVEVPITPDEHPDPLSHGAC